MTREDAIATLRRRLPALSRQGVTGLSLVGRMPVEEASEADPIEVLLDIDLAAHPDFDLLALVGIDLDLQEQLGVPVRAYVLGSGMLPARREALIRDAVPITG